jgi:hypothetical protein
MVAAINSNISTSLGKEGQCLPPKCVTIDLPFNTTNPIQIDLTTLQEQKQFVGLQSLFIQTTTDIITITVEGTRQVFVIPAARCAYLPIVCPDKDIRLTISSSGVAVGRILLMNYYIAPIVWATA